MNSEPSARLLGDIGGTHARFAWQTRPGAPLTAAATYLCAEHASLPAAIKRYLADHAKPVPRSAGIGIANPVIGDHVQMTNHHWSFSITAVQRTLGLQRLVVINDFTALALALPALARSELHPVGGGNATAGAPMVVLGPGTGLGVSGLLPVAGGAAVPISGEGGHVTLAPADDREAAVIEHLRQRFGHASAERALSGPGLVNLYQAACALSGQSALALDAAQVIAGARSSNDPCCERALELFFSFLGSVAGNLALTFGARGGVFIGGGIAPRLIGEILRSPFRARFESKGRFENYLRGIPSFVIDAKTSPAFLGAACALDVRLDGPLD